MAELALGIFSVAITGDRLAKSLLKLYNSARDTFQDIGRVGTNLRCLRYVLDNLGRVLLETDGIWSPDAQTLIEEILAACKDTFTRLEHIIHTCGPVDRDGPPREGFKTRLSWHFRKEEVRMLEGRIESFKATLQLLITVVGLADKLSQGSVEDKDELNALQITAQHIASEKTCLTDLSILEEQELGSAQNGQSIDSLEGEYHYLSPRTLRISAWLKDVVGFNETVVSPDLSEYSSAALSDKQRSIAGAASNDVERLLNKWTTLAERRSRYTQTVDGDSVGNGPTTSGTYVIDRDEPAFGNNTPKNDSTAQNTSCDCSVRHNDQSGHHIIANRSSSEISSLSISSGVGRPEQLPPKIVRAATSLQGLSVPQGHIHNIGIRSSSVPQLMPHTTAPEKESLPSHRSSSAGITPTEEEGFEIISRHNSSKQCEANENASSANLGLGISLPHYYSSSIEEWLDAQDILKEDEAHQNRKDSPISPFSDINTLESPSSTIVSSISSIPQLHITSAKESDILEKRVQEANKLMILGRFAEAYSIYYHAYNARKLPGIKEGMLIQLCFRMGTALAEQKKFKHAETFFSAAWLRQKNFVIRDGYTSNESICIIQPGIMPCFETYRSLWEGRSSTIKNLTQNSDLDLALRTGLEYGMILIKFEEFELALEVLEPLYPKACDLLGQDDYMVTLRVLFGLGRIYRCTGNFSQAKEHLENVYSRCKASYGKFCPLSASCAYELSLIAYERRNYHETLKFSREAADLLDLYSCFEIELTESLYILAAALRRLNEFKEAMLVFEEARLNMIEHFGEGHIRTLRVQLQLCEVLSLMNNKKDAESILSEAYGAAYPYVNNVGEETSEILSIMERLGSIVLESSWNEKDSILRTKKLKLVATIYNSLYYGQKQKLGIEAYDTLRIGHDYGRLITELCKYRQAQYILKEVWSVRKRVLGNDSPLSIQTGLQLCAAFCKSGERDKAIDIVKMIYSLPAILPSPQVFQTIECTKVFGNNPLTNSPNIEEVLEVYGLLDGALMAGRYVFHSRGTACMSALEFAMRCLARGHFQHAQHLLTWAFHKISDSSNIGSRGTLHRLCLGCGLSASALAFISKNIDSGNRLMRRVVNWTAVQDKDGSYLSQKLSYFHSALLFLQDERNESVRLLYWVFKEREKKYTPTHYLTIAAGELFALALMIDGVITNKCIPEAVGEVNNLAFSQQGGGQTLLMNASFIIANFFLSSNLNSHALVLFNWLLESQKKLIGLCHKPTISTLAIIRGIEARMWYHKVKSSLYGDDYEEKEKEEKKNSIEDPQVFLSVFWEDFINCMFAELNHITGQGPENKLIPQIFANRSIWKSFKKEFVIPVKESFDHQNKQTTWMASKGMNEETPSRDAATARGGFKTETSNYSNGMLSNNYLANAAPNKPDYVGSFISSLVYLSGSTTYEFELAHRTMSELYNTVFRRLNEELDSKMRDYFSSP